MNCVRTTNWLNIYIYFTCLQKINVVIHILFEQCFIQYSSSVFSSVGLTPKQKEYRYPQNLRKTEDHEKIIGDYRDRHGIPPLPSMSEDVDEEKKSKEESMVSMYKFTLSQICKMKAIYRFRTGTRS